MKALSCLCAALAATVLSASGAGAITAPKPGLAPASDAVVKVNGKAKASHHYRHRRGDPFRNWCAYNCYRVSRYARPPLGRYHYSQYAYDQDLPFPYRFDPDASLVDNALGAIHPYTGDPFLRLFERQW